MPKKLEPKGYSAAHKWVVKTYGKASLFKCSKCKNVHRRMEWANLSGQYKRERSDWAVMCNPCHQIHDLSGFYVLRKDKIGEVCLKCLKLFEVHHYRRETAKFCSISCGKKK